MPQTRWCLGAHTEPKVGRTQCVSDVNTPSIEFDMIFVTYKMLQEKKQYHPKTKNQSKNKKKQNQSKTNQKITNKPPTSHTSRQPEAVHQSLLARDHESTGPWLPGC